MRLGTTTTINLALAKARLSELTDLADAGGTVIITRRGKAVAKLVKPDVPRKAIDLAALQGFTARLDRQTESAGEFVRHMRDEARY